MLCKVMMLLCAALCCVLLAAEMRPETTPLGRLGGTNATVCTMEVEQGSGPCCLVAPSNTDPECLYMAVVSEYSSMQVQSFTNWNLA